MPPSLVLTLLLIQPAAGPAQGWVVLPVQEYRELRAKAYPPEREPEPPPVESALTRLDYALKVAGDSAVGEARLTVDVFREGWVRVQVPAGLRVREARLDGRPVSLVDAAGDKGAAAQLLLSRPGRSLISLDVALPVTASGGSEAVTLPASSAALSRAELTVPRQGVELGLAGGFLAERSELPSATRFVAHGRAGEGLVFSWRSRSEQPRLTLPPRLRGSLTELVGLGEDGAQLSAEVGLEVVQGAAAGVTLTVPEGLVIDEVSGPLVADWESGSAGLKVSFLEPLTGRASLRIAAEARLPREGQVTVPLLRLPAAERETGGVAVEVLGSGELTDQQARGLDPADASDLGGPVAGRDTPSLAAFRFRPQEGSGARSLAVSVARYTPEAVLVANVEEARYQVLLSEDGKALVRARYAVRNNQRGFLGVELPAQATLWSAAVSGKATRPGRSPQGALLLPLQKGRAGEEAPAFAVELVYLDRVPRWSGKGRGQLALPALDLSVSRTGLELYHSPRFRVRAEPGTFRPEAYAPPGSAALGPVAAPAAASLGRAAAAKTRENAESKDEIQGLVERFQKEGRVARVAGALPVQVPFPPVGPLLFLASELTPEGSSPALDVSYQPAGKGGRR